jgi:hypothetical protein
MKMGYNLTDLITVVGSSTSGPSKQLQSAESGASSIHAVDSDFLFLLAAPSTLGLGAGLGVFARHDIQRGDIICECRGEPSFASTYPSQPPAPLSPDMECVSRRGGAGGDSC